MGWNKPPRICKNKVHTVLVTNNKKKHKYWDVRLKKYELWFLCQWIGRFSVDIANYKLLPCFCYNPLPTKRSFPRRPELKHSHTHTIELLYSFMQIHKVYLHRKASKFLHMLRLQYNTMLLLLLLFSTYQGNIIDNIFILTIYRKRPGSLSYLALVTFIIYPRFEAKVPKFEYR